MSTSPRKIIFQNWQSPGDIVMLLHAITSLHESHPGKFITDVDCPAKDIFYANPLITPLACGAFIGTYVAVRYMGDLHA